jgi:signal transduction histidine kinase
MLGRLEAAFTEQQRFLTDVSHELRSPMQVIKGHLEVLNRLANPSREETRETLTLVLDEVDRMARLVGQLLTLARSAGAVIMAPIALRPFLEDLVRKAETLAPRQFALEVSGDPTVAADRDALTQIVLNLTQNAVDNTTPDDRIALGAGAHGDGTRIWVRDTGRGIPAAALPHVFERFYRVNDNGGSGLGLSIVDALVRALGGTVTVHSRQGEGTTFEIVLPAA